MYAFLSNLHIAYIHNLYLIISLRLIRFFYVINVRTKIVFTDFYQRCKSSLRIS